MKWFSYKSLNLEITRFKYCGSDSLDWPLTLPENSYKFSSSAIQNWVLLRLLPIMIGSRIKNYDDDVWKLYLLLRKIVAIVCSSKLRNKNVNLLAGYIEDYLEIRYDLFLNIPLRPKHHFTSHYLSLILHFEPLNRLWTLRFERKHICFKRCARRLQNFKNVSRMLAEKHQLLQAYLSCGSLFPEAIIFVKSTSLRCSFLPEKVACALNASKILFNDTDNVVPCLTVYGTNYRNDMFVFIETNDEESTVSRMELIIVIREMKIWFCVETFSATLVPHLGVYSLSTLRVFRVVQLDACIDYYLLQGYSPSDGLVVVPKHAVL